MTKEQVDALIERVKAKRTAEGKSFRIVGGISPVTGRDFSELPYDEYCSTSILCDRKVARAIELGLTVERL